MKKNVVGFGVASVVIVLALVVYFFSAAEKKEPDPVPEVVKIAEKLPEVAATPAEPVSEPEVMEEPLLPPPPSLQESDHYVVELVESISPPMLQWIVPEEQVRKLVLAVDQLAAGKLPQRHKPLNYEMPPFEVRDEGGELIIPMENFDRLNPLIDTIVEIDPEILARYYQSWLPVLQSAYDELGNKHSFQSRVEAVIKRIKSVGPAPQNPVLIQPNVFYQYADQTLERRSPLEKWLWRMGDDNREKLQAYLRELEPYL